MDNIILTLHPVTDAARNVLKDPRNASLLDHNDDSASESQILAFSLSLNQAPKKGTDYVGLHICDFTILTTCTMAKALSSFADTTVLTPDTELLLFDDGLLRGKCTEKYITHL